MLRFQSSSEVSSNGAAEAMPALATTMSIPPKATTASRKAAATAVSSVTSASAPATASLPNALAEFGDGRLEARLVDVGEHDAGAFAHEARGDRLADAARPAGDERDAAGERFRLRHALELGLLQEPVFDVERLLLGEADIAADAGGAAHDVDRVDVEFRGDPRRRLVLGEGRACRRRGRDR